MNILQPLLIVAVSAAMPHANAAPPPAGQPSPDAQSASPDNRPTYQVRPIGWVRKAGGRTTIELYDEYRPALLGVDALDSIWVLWWLDRNDTPDERAILQVHPRGNPANPIRGVFATRAPMRPNLIALTRCRVLGVQGNVIEIDDIDAYPDTPVLDIKPWR
jgi:tRNA-Thr(GGU) m(6)t(6)A37 methyltransferase TsaA